jgi:uncharacterized protein (DUF1697 family)
MWGAGYGSFTMTRYVAFLRAINVGGHVVKMDKLRALFESVGTANVETFIASGNVIFETSRRNAAALELEIEARLQKALGYPVATFVRTIPEVTAVAARFPFAPATIEPGGTLFVGFLKDAPGAGVCGAVAALGNPSNEFAVHERELYWLRRDRLMESIGYGKGLEKLLTGPVTVRNVTTIKKIAAKWPAPATRAR